MNDFDPAELARIRRYGRADWRRLWPPGWERGLDPAQVEAQRKEFAKWERAFETPLARRLRKEREERERKDQERLEAEHQAEIEPRVLAMKAELASLRVELVSAELRWKAECAERKRRADIAWERVMTAFMRGDFASRRKANFNPNQPRVAAGNPDGGQWASDGEGTQSSTGLGNDRVTGRNDPHILSDETLDNSFTPATQLAQNDTAQRSRIDLEEERQLGGHAIEGHVNKNPNFLLSRARDIASAGARDGFAEGIRVGSFSSLDAANKLVNATLEQNRDLVDKVVGGISPRETLNARFGSPTGYEAYAPNERSQPYLRDTYGVTVVIDRDARVAKGYRVVTAFPGNF